MLTPFSRLATLATLLQQVVGNDYIKMKHPSAGYLRSSKKANENQNSVTRRSQGLFSYNADGTVSSTAVTTSSTLTQVNTITQGDFSTTSSTSTVEGVIAIHSGIQQGSGLATFGNLLISLQDQNCQTISTTTTSYDGKWTITNVEPGYYNLKIDVPSGFILMGYNSNEISFTIDSKNNAVVSVNCMLASMANSYSAVGSLTGTLLGLNAYSDVAVTISDLSGNIIATTKADVSGKFTFVNLVADTYSIHVDIPSLDSSMVTTTTTNFQVTVLSNQVTDVSFQPTQTYSQNEINAGISSNACGGINGFAWLDFDKNGVKTSKGSGLMDVSVSLCQLNGTIISTTKTDSFGFYAFNSVEFGVYQIIFVNPRPDILNFSGNETLPDNQANTAGIVGNVAVQTAQNTTACGSLVVKPGVKCGPETSNDYLMPNGAYGVIMNC